MRTTADVAARLNVDEAEAAQQLREAEREGLVFEDMDLSASLPDDQRRFWMLTPEGGEVWDRTRRGAGPLRAAPSPGA